MKTATAILIDPYAYEHIGSGVYAKHDEMVREVEVNLAEDGSIETDAIYAHLSAPEHEVRLFDVVTVGDGKHDVFVDDEGLFREQVNMFSMNGNVYAGRGLILGFTDEGASVPPSMTLAEAKRIFDFVGTAMSGAA